MHYSEYTVTLGHNRVTSWCNLVVIVVFEVAVYSQSIKTQSELCFIPLLGWPSGRVGTGFYVR